MYVIDKQKIWALNTEQHMTHGRDVAQLSYTYLTYTEP